VRAARAARAAKAAAGLLAALAAVAAPAALTAQTDPRLQSAIQLAQAGRVDSARAVVRRLMATLPPSDSTFPEALYASAILAADAATAARNLQRVVVEFGRSPWADEALLRLTQLYFAQGDPAATVQAAERMRRDYPDSPLKPRADFWGARAYFDLKDDVHGCELVREALVGTGDDVEFKNQVTFYASRCGAEPPPVSGAAVAGTTPPPSDTSHAGGATPAAAAPAAYSIQVLAVKSAAQVDEMLTRLKVMGFEARVVRDTSGLFKVRVGRYVTRAEAQQAQARLRAKIGGQPFLVEEP
jgi:cell division septation protein DedD